MRIVFLASLVAVCALSGIAVGAAQERDAPGRTARFELSGGGFAIAELKEGGQSFSNRDYAWARVPKNLEGCRYAQTAGGVVATMLLKAKSSGTVRAAVMVDRMLDFKDHGWTLEMPDRANTFSYTDVDNKLMIVMSRQVEKGQEITLPQVGWAGTLVLLPRGDT